MKRRSTRRASRVAQLPGFDQQTPLQIEVRIKAWVKRTEAFERIVRQTDLHQVFADARQHIHKRSRSALAHHFGSKRQRNPRVQQDVFADKTAAANGIPMDNTTVTSKGTTVSRKGRVRSIAIITKSWNGNR